MNYFEFFGLPVQFSIDLTQLRNRYLENSRSFHPDQYSLADDDKQMEMLEKSSLNNEAYKVLKDEDSRIKYALQLEGALGEEGTESIPQEFLMEMMEINEELMEIEMEPDPIKVVDIQDQIQEREAIMKSEIETILKDYHSDHPEKSSFLEKVKDYYLKRRYLLRIQKNLDKFASEF